MQISVGVRNLRSLEGRRTDGLVMWTPDLFPRITMYVAYILLNACRSGTDAFNITIHLFFSFMGLQGFVSKLYLLVYLI